MKPQLGLVDEDWEFLDALGRALRRAYQVVPFRDASGLLRDTDPNDPPFAAVLLTLGPGCVQAVETLRRTKPEAKVLLVTADTEPATVRLAASCRPDGLVSKSSPEVYSIEETVQSLLTGRGCPVSAGIARVLLDDCARNAQRSAMIARTSPSGIRLTHTECQIVQLMAAGLGNQELAKALGVSINTIEFHVRNIYRKFDVAGRPDPRSAAIERALQWECIQTVPGPTARTTATEEAPEQTVA